EGAGGAGHRFHACFNRAARARTVARLSRFVRDRSPVLRIRQAMRVVDLTSGNPDLDQPGARVLADAAATAHLEEPILLSWYDRDRDFESPAHASECHDACDVPGYLEYAESRGALIRVDVDGGRFVFCYRPLGEFANL
ncbi:MAG: AF1514 family protein, partial [Myxococcota bacterium]